MIPRIISFVKVVALKLGDRMSIFLEMHIEDAYRGEMIRVMYFNILHTNTQKKISSKGRKVKLKILISRLISLALYHRIIVY